jgi:hypothetical protein
MRLWLQGSIYASSDIDKPGEKDKIRREFRASQHKISPDHPHLVERVLHEMLPEDLSVPEPLPAREQPVCIQAPGVLPGVAEGTSSTGHSEVTDIDKQQYDSTEKDTLRYTKSQLREQLQTFLQTSSSEDEAFAAFRILCSSLDYVSENDILYLIGEINPAQGKMPPSPPARPMPEPAPLSPPPIAPDSAHPIEQAVEELLPGEIHDELDQTSPPVVVNPTSIEEPTPAPEITHTTPVAEPVHETSTTPTTQPSSSEEAPAALPDVQEGLHRIQQAMRIAHARGMTVDDAYPYVDKLRQKYGITAFPADFIEPLLALWQQPEPEPQPQSHTVPTDTCAEEEEWISTWDLPTPERLDCIADFLNAHPGKRFTRAEIEIGASYRRPHDHLTKEDYERLKRRVQRDLALLEKDGDVVHTTRPNRQRNTRGQNNDVHLYRIADPDQDGTPDPDEFPAGLRRDLEAV